MLLANTAPSDSSDVIAEELASMIVDGSITRQLGTFVRPEVLTATAPHPVFALRLDELSDGFDLARTRSTTWRYLLELNKQIVASMETSIHDGRHVFGNITTGPFVDGTANAILFADARTEDDPYRFAVVHVPALHVMLLWLQSDDSADDRFVPIAPTLRSLPTEEVYPIDTIARELVVIARRARTEQQPDTSGADDKGA